ncbi:MAG: NADH-quinone oxidoreductase subunit D [Leptolinea sp.]|jgi:NADH-quinone oxidoreductase subunit D/NADH-quinone oxidoreductase subunit C/D|nr:NADH-quinone oxidoreductase subunit D [Leptolinea sp.]
MSDQTDLDKEFILSARYPGNVIEDTRSGYSGYLVNRGFLLNFARSIRDELGFDYLSMVTAVDYYPEDMMEIVYLVYRTTGGPGLLFKVQMNRSNPSVPSLCGIYPGAELQEREIFDMFGVNFEDHPDQRRILTWEGFQGHPLRKDWIEPLFEEEVKPYKTRWPEGSYSRAEEKNPFGNNVKYPAGFEPEQCNFAGEEELYNSLRNTANGLNSHLKTDQIIVNLGPQHPSTHGVFRMAVLMEGETILELKPVMGYLHRNHEKIAERNTYLQTMPYTDRLDYLSSMSNNFGYALAVEKLLDITPPERADYIRVIMAELTRISSHIMTTGFLLNDLGAFYTPALYTLEERELILDIFEEVSGSRMMCNYFRFGGVVRDVTENVVEKIRKLVFDRLPRKIDELDTYLTHNEIVRVRTEGVGVLTADEAAAYSASGPQLRASGVPYDVRKADPYSVYDRFDFDIAVRYHGDIYDRYMVRLDEMRQSLRIIQQAIHDLPGGPVMNGKPQYLVRVPAGEAYGRVEGPKGELGYFVISNGKPNPQRYHVRAPSFINITSLSKICRGGKLADAIAVLGSLDIILGEVDR